MRFESKLGIAAIGLVLSACSMHEPSRKVAALTASATAEAQSNGAIEVRATTSQELASLDAVVAIGDRIDRLYPPSDPPAAAMTSRANLITAPGVIGLADGRRVQMDGVLCSPEGIEFISHLVLDPTTAIVAVPTTNRGDPISAEVWLADSELHNRDPSFGVSYSSIAETALKNGWCKPVPTASNKHNERYKALYEAFSAFHAASPKSGR